jgi:hypothetical protein
MMHCGGEGAKPAASWLAKQAHRFAMVHGVTDGGRATGDHHAGYYYNLTGHAPDITFKQQGNDRRPYPDDWPYMGSVVAMKRPQHPSPASAHHPAAQAEQAALHPPRPVRGPHRHGA